jgi:hypothetical protein
MVTTIYLLQLKKGKYYVGKTNDLESRLADHFDTSKKNTKTEIYGGSLWTDLYKPVKLIKSIENCDNFDEDKYTIKYMAKYGIENVRGGSFVTEDFDEITYSILQRMIDNATDACFKCGQQGHYARDCEDDQSEDLSSSSSDEEYFCNRCGHTTHNEKDCFATFHKNGKRIISKDSKNKILQVNLNQDEISRINKINRNGGRACKYCDKKLQSSEDVRIHEKICIGNVSGCCLYCRRLMTNPELCQCDKTNLKCWHCLQSGHIVTDCPRLF